MHPTWQLILSATLYVLAIAGVILLLLVELKG